MLKVAGLILAAALFCLINNSMADAQALSRPAPVPGGGGATITRISNRCRGADPTKLTPDERNRAQKTARLNAAQKWKIEDVGVHKCKSNNLMEVRLEARPLDNDQHELGIFLFFESHKSFRKALALHAGFEMKFEYTPIDQDTLWSEGEDTSFVKFLRISKVE
jgi:hypothetical protein